jgi:hypothetical protein
MTRRDKILSAVAAIAAVFIFSPCLFPPHPNLVDPTVPLVCGFFIVALAVMLFLLWPNAR